MNQPENKKILVEETVLYEGLQLHELFWQETSTRQFYVSVDYRGESATAALGEDPAFAADCYRAIRDGGVTPCTLCEIVADLRADGGKFTGALYKT